MIRRLGKPGQPTGRRNFMPEKGAKVQFLLPYYAYGSEHCALVWPGDIAEVNQYYTADLTTVDNVIEKVPIMELSPMVRESGDLNFIHPHWSITVWLPVTYSRWIIGPAPANWERYVRPPA